MVEQVIRNSAGHLVTLGGEEWQRVVDPATGEIRALPRSLVTDGDPEAPAAVPHCVCATKRLSFQATTRAESRRPILRRAMR